MVVHLPQNNKEFLYFTFFWLGGVFTLIYECYFILWSYHSKWNSTVVILNAMAFYLAFIIYSCMYKMISTDIAFKPQADNSGVKRFPLEGWKYCEICQNDAPPRSHHCKICNECILKRDHHCWFSGYCVGFHNHRYFICLVLHASVAGLIANVYNWEYVMAVKGGFTWTTLPSLLGPHVGLVFGYYTTQEFIITVITSVGFMFTLLFVSLLVLHIRQMVQGQVQFEMKKGITLYSMGFNNSVVEIFGSAGLWALLCPFVKSTLPGDGTWFLLRDEEKKIL
ncbi:hypothetical protein EGW08_015700 [Elysia chlorotica]|uniref:Palmitoyltransferase n=1 Tax=Elysia chlorotica TaxID=188477 RepID=A0A3S0ZDN6_ELYCH|nr:hypothetical protein EGW08_015700 [Elysia chlorotica]